MAALTRDRSVMQIGNLLLYILQILCGVVVSTPSYIFTVPGLNPSLGIQCPSCPAFWPPFFGGLADRFVQGETWGRLL